MKIVDLYVGTYHHMAPESKFANVEKEKNYKYLHACMERRHHFTPLVLSFDGIPGSEVQAVT